MKGEYLDNQDHHHHNYNNSNNSNNNSNDNIHSHHQIFPKFPPPHLQFPPHNNPFPFPIKDSAAPTSPPSAKKPKTAPAEDGSTIELPRRPRGRPPGSKNKPKPPFVITREPEQPPMSPYILELPGGSDIVDSLTRFTRRHDVGICVLTASGAVSNVTLKLPAPAAPGATVTFHGRFDILSLSAVCLVQQTVPFFSGNVDFGFTISLGGPQGQIVGGIVVGPLLSAGTVYVVATSFNSPTFHRLPLNDEDEGGPVTGDGQSGSPVSGDGSGGGGCTGGGNMGMYSCQMGSSSSDVIWTPTARPPPAQHSPY